MPHFAVTMEPGPNWDLSRDRREQEGWEEHAVFMDGLVEDGFIVIGGPLDDLRSMHAIEAADEQAVRDRFAEDPWAPTGMLQVAQIQPWTIWLDGR